MTDDDAFPATSLAVTVRVVVWPSATAVVQLKAWLAEEELSGLQPVVVPVSPWL